MTVLEELARLSDERFLDVYQSLSENGFGPLDLQVAESLRFRPKAIKKLPMDKRAKRARWIITSQGRTELAYELFGTYLVRTKNALVTGFLDATGIEHDEGMIEDTESGTPDPAKIPAAIEKLDAEFDSEDVTLYLALCAEQWPDSSALQEAWKKRAGANSTS